MVGLRQVDAGNIVHASDATGLLVVTQLQPIAVIFTMPEDQLPQVLKLIRTGNKLVVEAYDRSQATKLATGSLLTLDNEIDTTTGTVKAKAIFDNKDGALFPNQFVNVRLILEQRANSLVVPASAIQTGNGGNFVYLVKPGNPPADASGGGGGKKGAGGGKKAGAAGAAPAAAPEAGAGAGLGWSGGFRRRSQRTEAEAVLRGGAECCGGSDRGRTGHFEERRERRGPGGDGWAGEAEAELEGGPADGDGKELGGRRLGRARVRRGRGRRWDGVGDNRGYGADGSTPSPDAGQGSIDEPRGKRGSHGPQRHGAGRDAGCHGRHQAGTSSQEAAAMSPSRPFILRPVATSLLMVAILLAGFVAYMQLPVSALPEVDYPIIQVQTFYPGASPEVMASSVTAPLERQFGQIPGLKQMTSTSSGGGSASSRCEFQLNESIDVAQQDVQAAINAGYTYLPTDLPNPPVYSKVNPADAPILTLALTSNTLPLSKVEDLADTILAQKISQLSGVGLVSIAGGQKPAVRIQANPTALASYGLSLEDIRTALGTANVDQAKGSIERVAAGVTRSARTTSC